MIWKMLCAFNVKLDDTKVGARQGAVHEQSRVIYVR